MTMLHPDITVEPRAWQVEFAEAGPLPDGVAVISILEPRTLTALLTPLAVSDAIAPGALSPEDTLKIVWMPPGANAPPSMERDVEDWMQGSSAAAKEVNVRADVRTVRVAWCDRRTVIYANEGDLPAALDAVLRFSVAHKAALDLEENMRATWATIESDVALTHALTLKDLKMQGHVNRMTEVTTNMKMAWLRLFRSLEQFEPAITNPSRRIFAELASAASLYDRLETLENTVQFALDHYEISNTRLIDMYLARTDRVNSIFGYGIVTILLLVQIWIMLRDSGLI